MTGLLSAELLKLRTVRTPGILGLAVLVVVAGAVTATASTSSPAGHAARQVLAVAGPVQTAALLLGILAVTTEYRHGTMTPVLLVTPGRFRLLAAKLVVLSNYATPDMRRKCLELGADRVFDKSNEIDALILYCCRLADGGTGNTEYNPLS